MKYFENLKNSRLFADLSEMECWAMMHCLKTKIKLYSKNQIIVQQGDEPDYILLVLKGVGKVLSVDTQGEIHINDLLTEGDVFGLDNLYDDSLILKNTFVATEKVVVMEINKHRLLNPCPNKCFRHEMVLKGMIRMLAKQNSKLSDQFLFMNKKTTREKLIAYFNYLANKANSNYFTLPFNKTDLASYLAIDRSAMSTELKRMKEQNIIDFEKREFHLLKKEV